MFSKFWNKIDLINTYRAVQILSHFCSPGTTARFFFPYPGPSVARSSPRCFGGKWTRFSLKIPLAWAAGLISRTIWEEGATFVWEQWKLLRKWKCSVFPLRNSWKGLSKGFPLRQRLYPYIFCCWRFRSQISVYSSIYPCRESIEPPLFPSLPKFKTSCIWIAVPNTGVQKD